jgi:hypothetical protein
MCLRLFDTICLRILRQLRMLCFVEMYNDLHEWRHGRNILNLTNPK